MKLRLTAFFLVILCGAAFGQVTSQEWQAKAVHKYSELGVSGSRFNKRFIEAYNERRKTKPHFFDNPQWPLMLADELASNPSAVPSTAPVQASPSPTDSTTPSNLCLDAIRSFFGDPTRLVVTALIALAILFKLFSDYQDAQRRKHLLKKYGDQKLVDMILKKMFWHGQTAEQLRDSLGHPAETDHKAMKTINREIWKYNRTGHKRFGLRITVDDGFVAGWDQK